jgi:hypothetical protein
MGFSAIDANYHKVVDVVNSVSPQSGARQQKMSYKVSESELQLAQVTKQINLAKALPQVNKELLKDMKSLIN